MLRRPVTDYAAPASPRSAQTTGGLPRVDVLGVGVSAISLDAATAEISRWIIEGEHRYVCVTGVHGVMESQRDAELRRIHNESGLTTADGMPLVWCARRAGFSDVTRVYGPDLMLALLERARDMGWSSFFYGGGDGTADRLVERLQEKFPGLKVAGTYTPPFRPLTAEEDEHVVTLINDSGAQILWVGLSTPKQEHWVAEHLGRLRANSLLGVGAAFDFHAGTVAQAPVWVQQSGFEWLFRLVHEPRRLWRRYLRNNPAFVVKMLWHRPRPMGTLAGSIIATAQLGLLAGGADQSEETRSGS